MQTVKVEKLNVGDRFENRRGNQFTVLEIEEETDEDRKVIRDRNGTPRMLLRIEDHQTDKRYQVRYMGSDEVFLADPKKPGGNAKK